MKKYTIKFVGTLSLEADNKEQALAAFYANILEIFEEAQITDVTVSETDNDHRN
jgi:hypothetical protein